MKRGSECVSYTLCGHTSSLYHYGCTYFGYSKQHTDLFGPSLRKRQRNASGFTSGFRLNIGNEYAGWLHHILVHHSTAIPTLYGTWLFENRTSILSFISIQFLVSGARTSINAKNLHVHEPSLVIVLGEVQRLTRSLTGSSGIVSSIVLTCSESCSKNAVKS